MPLWSIPMAYTVASILLGLTLPRLEHDYLPWLTASISVASAQAFFSAVGSGMMALTGIVFAIAFVMVQFSSAAYSPRVAVVLGGDPVPFHTLGIFFATFTYSLAALVWTDRGGSGQVPLGSAGLVALLLILSMIGFGRLVQSLQALQINSVLRMTGDKGRAVILAMFPLHEGDAATPPAPPPAGTATQAVRHAGAPLAVRAVDIPALVGLAQRAGAVIVLECGVGDTLVDSMPLLRVHGAAAPLPEQALRAAIRLGPTRTFEQDPKYAIRLLVDIAIRALSPAVNDPTTAVQALDQIEDLLRRLGRSRLDAGQAADAAGIVRLHLRVPEWEDYLALAFDEIRQYGLGSVQVLRRLRAVLVGLAGDAVTAERRAAVQAYLLVLEQDIATAQFDPRDRGMALQEDRQGLGLPRRGARA